MLWIGEIKFTQRIYTMGGWNSSLIKTRGAFSDTVKIFEHRKLEKNTAITYPSERERQQIFDNPSRSIQMRFLLVFVVHNFLYVGY